MLDRFGLSAICAVFLLVSVLGCASRSPYLQGSERLKQGNYKAAVKALTQALEKDPANFGALLNRGVAYENLNELDKSLQDYSRAVKLVPNFGRAYHYRGHIHSKMQKYERAIEDYNQALSHLKDVQIDAQGVVISTDESTVCYDRGNAHVMLQQYPQAIESYDRAITINAGFATAYNNRGVAYSEMQNPEAACRDRSKACELNYAPACTWVREHC